VRSQWSAVWRRRPQLCLPLLHPNACALPLSQKFIRFLLNESEENFSDNDITHTMNANGFDNWFVRPPPGGGGTEVQVCCSLLCTACLLRDERC
jgi:hypothetical protein